MSLIGGSVEMKAELINIQESDLEKILEWRNKESIRSVMYNDELIKWTQHLEWYHSLEKSKNKLSKIFSINDTPVGIVNFNNIDEINLHCYWGFYIGVENSSKGTGLLLGLVALDYIFTNYPLVKVYGEVLESNNISIRYHEKLGFKKEGILRAHIKRKDFFENVHVFSILRDEWMENKAIITDEVNKIFNIKVIK